MVWVYLVTESCGRTYILLLEHSNSSLLKSPHYPSNYPSNIGCFWVVYLLYNGRPGGLLIEVVSFRTELLNDLVRIKPKGQNTFVLDGETKVRSIFVQPDYSRTDDYDVVEFSFTGDSTVEYKGFHFVLTLLFPLGKLYLISMEFNNKP